MFVCLRLVLKHPIQEQPDSRMPKNAKDINLHPKKRILEYLSEGVQTNKLTNKKVMMTQLTQTLQKMQQLFTCLVCKVKTCFSKNGSFFLIDVHIRRVYHQLTTFSQYSVR